MPRKKLPRALKQCEREGCEKTFVITIGAKYVPKYCCSSCAAIATATKRKKRKPRNDVRTEPRRILHKKSITLDQIQNYPINYEDQTGGKFAKILNRILSGEVQMIGIS